MANEVKILKEINVYCDAEQFAGGQKKYRTIFRKEEVENIYVDVVLNNVMYMSAEWKEDVVFELHNSTGKCVSRKSIAASMDETDVDCKLTVCFKRIVPDADTYSVYAFINTNNEKIGTVEFKIVELPEDYDKCFTLDDFSFYRKGRGEAETDYRKNPHSSFDIEELESVDLFFMATNKLDYQWPSEFIVSLFNDAGMLKERVVCQGEALEGKDNKQFYFFTYFGKDKKSYWRKGGYRVEVIFMNELIIVAPFVVGDKNIETPFNPLTVQPRTKHGGKRIISAPSLNVDPLEQINGMIGLHSLKKELKRYVDRVQYNKVRSEAGFKVKPVSLHSVYFGNPGTGKTTVAALMGKIFHDLGLLTKGHVVVEERNSLTGKFYGTEEEKTTQAIERAKGGVLFIDEAYNLLVKGDPKDPGRRIIETLLTTLSDEQNRDIMIILAGYPDPMIEMLNENPGMKSRLPNVYHFDDYNVDELMQIADSYLTANSYVMTDDARATLRRTVENAWNLRDSKFGNGRYIISLMENEVIPNLASRLVASGGLEETDSLSVIEKCDIPQLQPALKDDTMANLDAMVGLSNLKKSVTDHLNYVRFAKMRNDMGKFTSIPPLHMVFTGNPGTGKTTVADFISEIYHSLGILSRGHLVTVNRSDLVDNIIGGTEAKTKTTIELAKGGVLFIDEAYSLLGDERDFGRHVIETLLTTLSKDNIDLVVILAGYPAEMEKMIASNPGLRSRFPYTFHFEDYSPEELMQVADLVVSKKGFEFSAAARDALNALVRKEHQYKDNHFGNARYVTRLITTQIIPNMSKRVIELTEAQIRENPTLMETIEFEDIPIDAKEIEIFNNRSFDETAIEEQLVKLDAMIGLTKVKDAIHKFVDISRFLNHQGKPVMSGRAMKWSFTGNTGNGKSTVAEIFAGLLKAMNLLSKGHLVELKAEELYCVPAYKADETLKENMLKSQQGLLFIDSDAPIFKNANNRFDSDQWRIQLSGYTSVLHGPYALVIAEHEAPRQDSTVGDFASLDQIFHFEDFTESELLMILQQMIRQENMTMDEEAAQTMTRYIAGLYTSQHLGFANARTMRVLANTIINNAYLRISKSTEPDMLQKVIQDDVASFVWTDAESYFPRRKHIGFRRDA